MEHLSNVMEETEVEKAKTAIETGNLRDVGIALQNKYIRAKDRVGRDGFTLIHWACFYGNLEVTKDLESTMIVKILPFNNRLYRSCSFTEVAWR